MLLRTGDFPAVVDTIGVGAGVVARLREQGLWVEAFQAAARSEGTDESGELQFLNRRAEGWWRLRALLDPARKPTLALPPDDLLIGELTAPTYRTTSNGRSQIESKDEIRKRLGRSSDRADAVMMAFATEAGAGASGIEGFLLAGEIRESMLDDMGQLWLGRAGHGGLDGLEA